MGNKRKTGKWVGEEYVKEPESYVKRETIVGGLQVGRVVTTLAWQGRGTLLNFCGNLRI